MSDATTSECANLLKSVLEGDRTLWESHLTQIYHTTEDDEEKSLQLSNLFGSNLTLVDPEEDKLLYLWPCGFEKSKRGGDAEVLNNPIM